MMTTILSKTTTNILTAEELIIGRAYVFAKPFLTWHNFYASEGIRLIYSGVQRSTLYQFYKEDDDSCAVFCTVPTSDIFFLEEAE